ncbi:Eukaryotic translation initiation factor 5B [Psilocybe cubensis]|uniref:Eukaryotic translation initiation factor 5B n=1 Tax=Psilocybe cubensis TaxID=181762 RepID=A0ACB8H523_PSICU|nr:Eukaryotic translation initiation factor 5B [Psilocybe cubensis]KAH9483008.1 Eukaryotic translation initiation factor 5B [Psilocybe cubensis]
MAPKGKGKKGKKGDDDFWDKAGEAIAPNNTSHGDAADDDAFSSKPKKTGFSAFSAVGLVDDIPGEDDDDGPAGGLMSLMGSGKARTKDKKKKNKVEIDLDDLEESPAQAESKKPIEVTAEELADEEWGSVKDKKKKDKKGKGKKAKQQDDEEEGKEDEQDSKQMQSVDTAPTAATETPASKEDDEEQNEAGTKVLSKKEKEKLKKEREKAKKKAQAAAKKVAEGGDAAPSPPAVPESTTLAPTQAVAGENNEEDGDDATEAKPDSKKKKKKKAAKKDEEPTPAPSATTKKKGGAIGALKALMEEKKRLEEEARRIQEEERKRIEEEERRAEEEERKREEEKQRKKDKEKAKRELAKKEGRLLTKKQREEKQMAEIRKQALLASGVQIEGLQQASGSVPAATKKVVYGNRKKKGPGAKDQSPTHSRPRSPEPMVARVSTPAAAKETNDAPKSDWEASSDEEPSPPVASNIKDSWDATSEEEEVDERPVAAKTAPKEVPVSKISAPAPKTEKPVSGKIAPSTTVKGLSTKPPAPSAKPPVEESSSEEDSEDSDEDSDSDSDDSSSEDELTSAQRLAAQKKAEAAARRAKAHQEALAARSKDNLRSPICCILGHVDTGKTKLLDKIRQTNVQEGEAGGITQQIGATYFPVDAIKTKTAVLNRENQQEYKIPGLLIIDTPGHESFTNLRSRGSSLCNIAILVVDIMHGLEAQTLESLRLLRDRKTPFIVALNKIDRIYGWDATPDGAFQESLAKQSRSVQREFEDRVSKTILAFAEEGLNACLYYENKNLGRNVSLVPTSAITGEGVPDMIMLLVNLTQQRMSDRLMYLSELECTVLEVKVIEGLGTTIDVVLSNGILREGDKIVVCGLNGPIVTQVRALLTPQPLRELRIKSAYVHHKEVKAALGVKITAPDLEKAIAGSRLLVVGPDDDEDELKEEVMSDLTTLFENIDKSGRGVCVQASTLGSLEALLDFLKSSKIPVSGINIGPVFKRDVMRASTMLEKAKELACILCFDVPIDKEAERLAEEMGIRLFKADIIYHLFDSFKAYNAEITEAKRRDAAPQAVWPCRLKVIAAFCKRDPIILGVDILDGSLRIGTPLCVVKIDPTTGKKDIIDLGKMYALMKQITD